MFSPGIALDAPGGKRLRRRITDPFCFSVWEQRARTCLPFLGRHSGAAAKVCFAELCVRRSRCSRLLTPPLGQKTGRGGAAALRGPRGGPPPPLPARGRCRRVPDRPPRCGSRGAAPVRAALCGGCGAALRPIRELRAGASCRGLCWGSSLGAAVALLLCHSSPRAKSVTEALSPAVAADLRARPAGGKGVFCQLGPLLPYSCDALLVPGSPSALQCFKMLPSGPCRQPTPGRSGHCRHEGDAARGDAPGEAAPPCRGG